MIYLIMNVVGVIISITIVLFYLDKLNKVDLTNKSSSKIEVFINKYYKYIIVGLFLITIATTFYKITDVPRALHVDEAGMAYDAKCIAEFGVDRYLNKNPVYLINFGGGQSSMYAYLASFFIKIFGYSVFIIRLPAALSRITIFISGIYLLKNEKNKVKTILFLFLFSILPYFIMQSRWGLDCNLLVCFMTISVTLFYNAIINKKKVLFFISGLFFGLSLYTYILSWLIIPIFLLLILGYLLIIKKIKFKDLIVFGLPLFCLAIPLILFVLVDKGYIGEIKGIITVPKLLMGRGQEISLKYLGQNIKSLLNILTCDGNIRLWYNALPYFGTIYYFSIPYAILGLCFSIKNGIQDIKQKKFNVNLTVLFLLISVLVIQILYLSNINRSNAIFVALLYFVTIGIYNIFNKSKKSFIVIFLLLLINFGMFFNCYIKDGDDIVEKDCNRFISYNYKNALEYAESLGKSNIYFCGYVLEQPHIYVLLNNDISPYEYSSKVVKAKNGINYYFDKEISEIDDDSVYIYRLNNKKMKTFLNEKNCNQTNFDYIGVCYK